MAKKPTTKTTTKIAEPTVKPKETPIKKEEFKPIEKEVLKEKVKTVKKPKDTDEITTVKEVLPKLKPVTIERSGMYHSVFVGGVKQSNTTGTESNCAVFKKEVIATMKAQVNGYLEQNHTQAQAIQLTNDLY